MEAAGQYFVAPDNGVLAMILPAREAQGAADFQRALLPPAGEPARFTAATSSRPWPRTWPPASRPRASAKLIDDYLRPAFEKPHRTGKRTWTGRILKIDRFGNVITNFHVNDFRDLETRNFTLALGPEEVTALARNYCAEAAPGELFLIVGSSGYYEVSFV